MMASNAWVTTLMRVVLGILFVAHGISKFRMGLGNVAGWFDSVGVPGALAYVIGPLELIGGLLLIVGLFTRYVSALFIIMLLGAILTLKLSAGLLGSGEMAGYELDVAYMLVALYLSVAKPAPLSVDRIFVKSGI
ncbi:DoxX family protein [Paenibacillus hemerocallicola]|uniref:DoxX family protein n=1 Tax=Paenibacillus hemerocallicola TaxID=1172614 RepID=A0A5C4TER5_9BACL|nr:DoxX family protein [Paenibacillus hemerocallicola]TNJ66909.1 DoxX family protein [Paenibacillus hemerocallicola]